MIDLSASGAAISADHEPEIGEPLAVGKAVSRVVRRLDVGFAVQFVEPIDRDIVEETVRTPDEWDRAMRAREAAASTAIASMVDTYDAAEANYAI